MDANEVTVIIAVIGIVASIFLITTVKKLGRRTLYFASSVIVIGCCIALSKFMNMKIYWMCRDFFHYVYYVVMIFSFLLFCFELRS